MNVIHKYLWMMHQSMLRRKLLNYVKFMNNPNNPIFAISQFNMKANNFIKSKDRKIQKKRKLITLNAIKKVIDSISPQTLSK